MNIPTIIYILQRNLKKHVTLYCVVMYSHRRKENKEQVNFYIVLLFTQSMAPGWQEVAEHNLCTAEPTYAIFYEILLKAE